MILLSLIIGAIFWTFAEYVLHRFLGHEHKGRNFFKAEHGQHHAKYNYFAPSYKKIFPAVLAIATLFFLLSTIAPMYLTLAFLSGFLGMYILYEVTHYRYHIRKPVAKPFIILRKHHFYHHFHNPKVNHGVTTRFWDRMFGTFVPVEKVRVPKKMAMKWLLENEEIKGDYASHFYLVEQGKSVLKS